MTLEVTITPLDGSHDRTDFSCGVPALDRYFQTVITQDIKRRVTNGFVAVTTNGAVAGYYTLAATGLALVDLPAELTKRLPRYPLLPAGLIGRLAIDLRFHGKGLGAALIIDAIGRAMRSEPAIFALVVDAKDDGAAGFYRHLGFTPFVAQTLRLFLPIAEAARRLSTG